jgi:hypothetical protein
MGSLIAGPRPLVRAEPAEVRTNLVYVKVRSVGPVLESLSDQGILAIPVASDTIRLAFHRGIPDAAVDRLVAAFTRAVKR